MAGGGRVTKLETLPSMITQPDEVYLQAMDENEVLGGLRDKANPARRAAVIEELRASVRRNGGRLTFEDRHGLFHVFQSSLCDSDPNVRLRCIEFISEIVPEFGTDLDNCMSLILPQLVSNLGNHTVTVKKSAIQTLHVYMRNSSNVGAVFNAIIEHGLESEDKRTRTESLVALPILITPNLAHEDLFVLTKALVGILESASRAEPTVLSLDRIRNVVGEEKFDDYLRRLPSNQQKLCSEAIQHWGRFYREDLENTNLRKAKSAGHLNSNGVVDDEESYTNGEKHNLDRGHTIAVAKGYAVRESRKLKHEGLEYGFVPQSVIVKLRDQSNWRVRAQGIEELKNAMGYLGDPSPVLPHLASLFELLLDFLDDINFKITVTSLQIIGLLIAKLGQNVEPFLKPLVNTLTNKLGDNKIVIRQENMRVLMHLMQILSPKPVLSVLTASLQHPKSKVREETLNVVIGALLTFPRSDFDLPEITNAIAPALADSKRKVRQAALEAFAVIAQAMGPGHLRPIVSAVDTIELTRGGDGVMAAVQARLARRQLPRLNSDGLVEYAIPVPTSGTVRGQSNGPRGADIEWVMAGAGGSGSVDVTNSARSTPGLNDSLNNSGPSPRRYYSAGKNRLPWEELKDTTSNQGDASDQKPQLVRNSWVPTEIVNDRSAKRTQRQATVNNTPSSAPTSTSKLTSTSYTEKYLRNLQQVQQSPVESHAPKPPDSSSSSSYAEIHRNRVKKEKSKVNLNATAPASVSPASSAGTAGAGGSYALLYKRGTIHAKPKASSSAEPAIGEVQTKESVSRSAHSTTPTALTSHGGFVPADEELFFSHRKSFPNTLSNSWPDWTEAHSAGRPFGRLSPVSHGHMPVADFDPGFDLDPEGKRNEPRTPVHIKPQLARSASKIRGLKNQDLVDGVPGIDPFESSLNRSAPLAPVTSIAGNALDSSQPPKDSLKQVHDQVTKRNQRVPPVGSEIDDNSFHSAFDSSNGLIKANGEDTSSESHAARDSPFSSKPRMARTPIHSKRTPGTQVPSSHTQLNSTAAEGLDVKGFKIMSKDIGDKHAALNSKGKPVYEPSSRTSGVGSGTPGGDEPTDMSDVSVVGQGILSIDKERADSMDDKVGKTGNGKLEYEPEESDEENEDDDDEDEEEDDEDDDDDSGNEDEKEGSDEEDEDEKEDDILEEDGDESSDSDSDIELNKGAEEGRERDMTPRTMRKSLSKSTRERMERKRQLEEERVLKEQQRIESLERDKAKQLKIQKEEEEHLRKKIMKEQQELERMLQKKEKERELEKQKQKLLQEQLFQQERALTERLLKQQEELEEIEREKQREREREKERLKEKVKQRQLRLQKEKEAEQRQAEEKKEEMSEKMKLQQKKEIELKKKLELEEADKRRRQQQASKDMKETLEDKVKDLSITGSSTPLKQPSGKPPRKKNTILSPHSDRDESYAMTDDPLDTRRHFSASSSSSSAAIWETALEDLQPFPNPDVAIKNALKYLSNAEDWEIKCEGLQQLRRISKNHPDSFGLQLHSVILAVVTEVKNLRSQVSRAGLCCLGDMFTCLGRQMDMDLEVTCKNLLLKSGETSGFIRDDVDKALSAMVYNVTPTRALVAFTSAACGNRNVAIRRTAAQFLSVLAERIGTNRLMSGAKDVTDRIIPAAAQFATDGGSETRYYGRKILYTIYDHPDFDKLLMKHVAANQQRQIRDIVDTMKTKGLGDPPSDHTSARQRKHPGSSSHTRNGSGKGSVRGSCDPGGSAVVNSPVASRESSRSGKSRDVDGEEHIPEVVSLLSSNDWKERLQGLDLFVELAERNPQGLGGKFTKMFDNFIPRLTDSNSKVNLYALQSLPKILPSLSGQSGALVPPVVAALTSNLASKNSSIFSTADEALTALTKHIDNISLVQPFCTTSQFGNSRVKPVIIEKLCLIVEKVYARKPQVINRYVVPLIWQLLGSASTGSARSGTGDIKNATVKLTGVVHSCMGKSLLEQSATQVPRIQERLRDITGVH